MATSAPASAAPKRITGKLSKPGYTVIALAASGEAKTVYARDREFKLSPPAGPVTLHLRAPNGMYAGPVVIVEARKRAIVGVRPGARLGEIKVAARKGYAKVAKRPPVKSINGTLTARAKKGVPIGAGLFGRVRSKPPRKRIPGDGDFDGVPEPVDIDDDGDLILDYEDSASALRAADHVPGHPPRGSFGVLSTLGPPTMGTAANASPRHSDDPSRPAFDDAEIDDRFKTFAALGFAALGGPGIASTELDCGGDPLAEGGPTPALMYCSRGGTGLAYHPVAPNPTVPPTEPFPGELGGPFDGDRDGQGTLPPSRGAGAYLEPRVTTAEVKTGDLFIERGNDANGIELIAFTTTLQYVFSTVPTLASYDDGPGGIAHTDLAYPRPPGSPEALPVRPRPAGDPFAGDIVVTMTFWRPQRRRIGNDPALESGDSPTWTDIGAIRHGLAGGDGIVGPCPQSAHLPETDDNLTDLPPGGTVIGGGGYEDLVQDRPANPAHKLTFTVNLSECLRAYGRESELDAPGDQRWFKLQSAGRGGQSSQALTFKRE